MTHSTPVTASIRGYRQVVFVTQNGLVSLNITNGQKLWDYPFSYNGTSLGASPVVHSNIVFVTQSYSPSSAAVWVDYHAGVWSVTNLWEKPVEMIWMTPVVQGGAIFGATGNSGETTTPLICMDLMTGETFWSQEGFGRGGVALMNNMLVGLSEAGQLQLIRPVTNSFEQIAAFRAITAGSCWNVPAVCDGKLLVRSTTQAACFDLSMPDLQLVSPTIKTNKLLLTVSTTNGAAIHTNRVAQMQVYVRTNLSGGSWSALTNRPAWSNGVVRIGNIDPGSGSPGFYRIGETE